MLSDTCFDTIYKLLEAITDYDYSDEYIQKLTKIIMLLNEIRDDLDHDGKGNLLKNDKKESLRIALKMIENAQKRREMSSVDFYEGVYD